MAVFIRIIVEGTETLVNLANVVSIQFWEEGEYRRPYAVIATTGSAATAQEHDTIVPHLITVQDEGPIAVLRAELRRVSALPSEDEMSPANEGVLPPTPSNETVVDATMPATGRMFDRSRPSRGYNRPT